MCVTYCDAIKAFYEAGCQYLQLDVACFTGLNVPFNDSGTTRGELEKLLFDIFLLLQLEGKIKGNTTF
ncbi:hypothetical protein ACTHO0_20845 [Cytobacillus praedii]|uniref:hypothetical protein n=1 Tax=Cytobacillus praedii TaxID=1742358 RepID=UPI003F8003C6